MVHVLSPELALGKSSNSQKSIFPSDQVIDTCVDSDDKPAKFVEIILKNYVKVSFFPLIDRFHGY